MTARSFVLPLRLNPRCPGRTSNPHLIHMVITGCDEGSGGGTRGECRVDVDESGAARIEADRNVSFRIQDFDLSFAVQREGTRATAERGSRAVLEESSVGNWN